MYYHSQLIYDTQLKSIYIFTLILFCIVPAQADIFGTLAGQVTDKTSGEPLVGVNIVIENAKMGAATDDDGFFLISHIPPGKYEISATMIGYKTELKNNVTVLVDLRTTLVFQLEAVTLELGEKIVVTAEAPLIQKDVTATTHFITREEFEALPVKNFKQIVDIQPGVAAGHVRGGRKTEVLYLVDGLPIKEAIEGEIGSDLPNSAVVDMTIQTGGFNAEYGNAMSGVVNIITREGAENFFSRVEFSSIDLHGEPQPFTPNTLYDYEADLSFGGPLFSKLKYFFSANYLAPNSRWKKEEFGVRRLIYTDSESRNINLVGKLSYQLFNNTKLTVQGLLSLWDWTQYDHQWKLNLEGITPQSKKSYRLNLSLTHTFSNSSYLNFYLSQYNVLKSVSGKSSEDQDAIVHEEDEFGNENLFGYVVSGDYPWWLDHQEIHNLAKLDFVNQINFQNQIKIGGEIIFYDLYKKNVLRRELDSYDPKFPRYISYDTEYEYKPNQGSFYIQDKMEYEGFVANAGIRYDFFNPRSRRPEIEPRVADLDTAWIISNQSTVEARIKHQFSPRLGFSFPISTTSELRFNYGYFFQMPQFDYLYTNANINVAYGFSPLGDPDLKPARTVAYEIGYRATFDNQYLLDVTFFNKSVSNLIDSNTFLNSDPTAGGQFSYGLTRFVNSAAVNVNGIEIFIKRRFEHWIGGKISYTYLKALGTGSSEIEKIDWIDDNYKVPNDQYPLSWDQRHTLVANLNLKWWDSWHANLLYRWNSGLPYTQFKGFATRPNNARLGPTAYFDIRLEKKFNWQAVQLNIFTEIYNIFNTTNILWVDSNGKIGGRLNDISALDLGRRFQVGIILSI